MKLGIETQLNPTIQVRQRPRPRPILAENEDEDENEVEAENEVKAENEVEAENEGEAFYIWANTTQCCLLAFFAEKEERYNKILYK